MATEVRTQLSLFLRYLAESLDIPDSAFQEAERRYQAVGKWLAEDDSPLAVFSPEICPQGSFRLGTVVKPINDKDEYDIDLVCELALSKDNVTQRQLKQMIGSRLKANKTYERMLDPEEGRRCWTLLYADGLQFHMDILPAIPDDDGFKQRLRSIGVPAELAEHALAITDMEHPGYNIRTDDWPRSNPRGYADWFRSRMQTQFDAQRLLQARILEANIEDVPDYRIKTPLQRVIQILKRHRDVMFEKDQDDKPISIIITTLAALAYDNQADLLDALFAIVESMPAQIQRQGDTLCVLNPVNPLENFADKWREHPQRERKFREWLIQVRADINTALQKGDVQAIAESLTPRFGKGAINQSLKRFPGLDSTEGRQIVQAAASVPIRFDVAHREVPPWPVRTSYAASVGGRYKYNGDWHSFRSNGEALPKYCELMFQAETNVPRPFSVYWQVVNTGDEAAQVNQLRGSIFLADSAGAGGLHQKERTAYTGSHWIECFVVKDGVCVARSGEYVVNIR